MTKAEHDRLDALQAAQSLAALTADLGDDQAAASATEQFLSGLLASAQADPARGGASVIGGLADQVKQARDNVASLASSGGSGITQNASADLQAQIDRANRRADIAEASSRISSQALSVFQGAGDIGMGRVVINQTNQMLHPADPRVLATIADASVAGMAQQASRTSPRTLLGL
jgi:hypothetical protein